MKTIKQLSKQTHLSSRFCYTFYVYHQESVFANNLHLYLHIPNSCLEGFFFFFWSQLSRPEIAFFHKRKLRHGTVCKRVPLMTNKFHLGVFKVQPVHTTETVNIHNTWKITKAINCYFPNSILKYMCTQLPAV